ncbi:ankyrin repeat-containing domain protein [Talaromyces proteolyticus]|uniref:Ankyrin repeat-containing domain protein n=1 Tax=Talaromyces proteolyticus TaxID=1131652 RepID=A0AAD4KYQ8_9EURO|nr:ankyrin repeat-containing domain protein [Talaromyces proteolyticus]KAH8700290.1 ankyrin repeat-containing domain protein [Talaromyces proteolyticus]
MADVTAVREGLLRVCQFIRVARRCLGGVRDLPETSERTTSLLCDLLELLYTTKDQLDGADEASALDAERLEALYELLMLFEASLKLIEVYLHPGGVGVREFRRSLLERTIIPTLEQYKVAFILSGQPPSDERTLAEENVRQNLRQLHEMEPRSRTIKYDEAIISSTDRVAAENFITLGDLCNRRQPGTCQWIFNHHKYSQWLQGSFRTLYCLGSAGIGKTFLSAVVIDSLQRTFTSPDVAIVFIFSHKEKDDGPGCPALLQNVLAQLIYRRRALSHATDALYDFESISGTKASSKAYQNAIRAEMNRFSKVFLVIDGLDTMADRERFLNRMQKLPEHAQLFITLREMPNTDRINHINISVPKKDITDYVVSRLHSDGALSQIIKGDEPDSKMEEDIIRYVVEKCHGIFLLAQLHLELLASYNEKALAYSALTHLPESLGEAYAEVMKRILSQHPSARKFIFWTLFSRKPLTVAELKYATMDDKSSEAAHSDLQSFENKLLDESCGILAIEAATGTVNLVHRTAKDALERMASASTIFSAANKEIAETCLTLISSDEVVDDCYMKKEDTSRSCCDTLLDYAASNWGYHACDAAEEEQTIQVLVTTFLNKVSPYKFPEQLGIGRYPYDWTPLHYLAYFDITCRSRRLLEQNAAEVDSHDNVLGMTPLHSIVELLLDNGADINAQTKQGDTALHLATERGQRRVMKLLLARDIDTTATNKAGHTALHSAIGTVSDEATIPLLVKSKVDTGDTGLHLAVQYKRPRILLFLLNKKAVINSFNKKAAKLNNCEALTLLLERGAQVESRSQDGVTALHEAAGTGNWIAFDLLLAGEGETLLHDKSFKPNGFGMASKLLDNGYTPLQYVFFLLLERGANITVETPRGENLLHITPPCNEEYMEILQILIQKGLGGWTPLHQTAFRGTGSPDISYDKSCEYLEMLLSHEAAEKETALHLATRASIPRPSFISLLLSRGADINARNNEAAMQHGADSSIKAPSAENTDKPSSIEQNTDILKTADEESGLTAFELAKANPLGALWFDEKGELRPSTVPSRRASSATLIDESDIEDDDDSETETGGTTVTGESFTVIEK